MSNKYSMDQYIQINWEEKKNNQTTFIWKQINTKTCFKNKKIHTKAQTKQINLIMKTASTTHTKTLLKQKKHTIQLLPEISVLKRYIQNNHKT